MKTTSKAIKRNCFDKRNEVMFFYKKKTLIHKYNSRSEQTTPRRTFILETV